jgi:hypothetical protein
MAFSTTSLCGGGAVELWATRRVTHRRRHIRSSEGSVKASSACACMCRMVRRQATPRPSSIFALWRGWSHRGMQAMPGEILQGEVHPVPWLAACAAPGAPCHPLAMGSAHGGVTIGVRIARDVCYCSLAFVLLWTVPGCGPGGGHGPSGPACGGTRAAGGPAGRGAAASALARCWSF